MKRPNNYINTLHTALPGKEANLFIYHSGVIDSQTIFKLLTQAENFLYSTGSPMNIKRKTIEIMTELLQNVYHHAEENEKEASTFLFKKKENRFMLTTTNMIHKNSIVLFKKQLSNLNLSTSRELTNMYREILKNGKLSNDNAGLGWIEIRRKSGSPVLFKFIPKDNNYSLFTVSVLV
jgi:hypothetical protein